MIPTTTQLSSRLAGVALAAALAAPLARAQDFGGTVEVDPRAGLATYDFHFDGPPRGAAFLYVGGLSTIPFSIPGLGNLYLDPLAMLPITPPLSLDASGLGRFNLTLPAHLSTGPSISFQSLFIDPQGTLRLSQSFLSLIGGIRSDVPGDPFSYGFSHSSNRPDFSTVFHGQPGGEARAEVKDPSGRVVGSATTQIGPSGVGNAQGPMQFPMRTGLVWEMWYRAPGQLAFGLMGDGEFR